MNTGLTQKRLKEVATYCEATGRFYWLNVRRNKAMPGHLHSDGSLRIMIDGVGYLAHRLAWLYVHGFLPENFIDHRDGVRSNNKIENLREVSHGCNMQNKKVSKLNKSGFPGVGWVERDLKWSAYIGLNCRKHSLGHHHTCIDAALARLTFEVWCKDWTCNHRGELAKAIKTAWPEFNMKSIS